VRIGVPAAQIRARNALQIRLFSAFCALFLPLFPVLGCRSAHVEITVVNRTGSQIRLLEVDYPSASFGADSLAAGAALHYKIQLQGEGPVKVQYTAQDGSQPQISGPNLAEGQQGKLEIDLEPGSKAEFHLELTHRQ
jgi:hypothetical protein